MAGAHYRLVMRQGPNPGQVYELDRTEVSIGRDIANDIVSMMWFTKHTG
jgi:hypothetical protein